ncbi:MAG: amino acid ABC transporter substrate-binding protein [Deltaproteobacteria bacterium]|nr:amino acid ABC transporter substrate-binding protein [Deltaproteobacteria bacterium]
MSKVAFCLIFILAFTSQSSAERETLKYVFTHYPPANYRSHDGEYRGFLVDIVREAITKRLGIPLSIAIFPWKRCQMLVEEGEADMLTTIPTPERSVFTVTPQRPIWVKEWRIHTYEGHPQRQSFDAMSSIGDLKSHGVTVISYIGNGWSKTHLEDAGIRIFNATMVDGMYRMLAAKRGDILLEDGILAAPALKHLGLEDKVVPTQGVVATSDFHMLIGKRSPFAGIVPRLETVIKEMWEDGSIERIVAQYRSNGQSESQ